MSRPGTPWTTWIVVAIAGLAIGGGVVMVRAQTSGGAGAATPPSPIVAKVGKLTVTEAELDARDEETLRQLRARTGTGVAAAQRLQLRRQVLESLIWQRLVVLEAERRGMPPQSVAEEYQRLAQPDRRQVEREVIRKSTIAQISYLPLRRSDYMSDPFPPRELEVLEWYRRHADEFPRPPEAHYSVIVVDQPALPEAQAIRADVRREWEALMQQRADSLLGAIRAGEPFDEAALRFGGARRFVVAQGRPFHPDFRGTDAELAPIQSAAAGTVLPHVVAWSPGRALVRVDARLPKHAARLGEVAGQIVERLSASAATGAGDARMRALYQRLADSLRGPAHALRVAIVDTGGVVVPEPSASEVERYYRLHLADYSSFDAERGAVVAIPFEGARDGIRDRLVRERRLAAAREVSARIGNAWSAGRRDAKAEGAPARVLDFGIVMRGAEFDTGAVARAVHDSLDRRQWAPGTIQFAMPLRFVVAQVGPELADHRPTLEQARPQLAARIAAEDAQVLELGARALWEREPERFRRGRTFHFSRLIVSPQDVLDVQLERKEVESHYRANIAEYSASPSARMAHLLIVPASTATSADAEARRKAQELLERARSGEDWNALVRANSADVATRERGGDVGSFSPGTMLPEFEAASFAMKPGEFGGPIRTREGWHVLKCVENKPREVVPLAYCYVNVASDLATKRANELTEKRADSLFRVIRTPSQAPAVARKFGYSILRNTHEVGDRRMLRELVPYFETIEKTAAGKMIPMAQTYRGLGVAISWVDSIAAPRVPGWDEAKPRALELARDDRAEHEMRIRYRQLDSLLRAGWSLDSVGALRGGLERRVLEGSGLPLVQLGGIEIVDSLMFGIGEKGPALSPGQETGWIEFRGGPVRLRLDARDQPDPVSLEGRVTEAWKSAGERRLYQLFEALKQRYGVRILDADMAATKPPVPLDR